MRCGRRRIHDGGAVVLLVCHYATAVVLVVLVALSILSILRLLIPQNNEDEGIVAA